MSTGGTGDAFDYDSSDAAFAAANAHLLVALKRNYDASGSPVGALSPTLAARYWTAEIANLVDDFILATRIRVRALSSNSAALVAASLTLGDGVTAGNFTILHRKADANNNTTRQWNIGPSTGIWAEQFNSVEDLNFLNSASAVIGGWQRTGSHWRVVFGVRHGGVAGPLDLSGAGTPESAVAAPVGSTFRRTDGGAGTSFYVKESGTGTTGWVGK